MSLPMNAFIITRSRLKLDHIRSKKSQPDKQISGKNTVVTIEATS